MLKSLLWKEFRELLPLCVAALAAQFLLIGYAVYGWRLHKPADVWGVAPLIYGVALLLAIGAGLWQNAHEANQNTFQLLLHRPVKLEAIFGAKLLFGAAICGIVGLMPLVSFSAWAESVFPNHVGPALSEGIWVLCTGIWLLYCGAFLSSLRPARWYASRIFPLLAGIFLYVVLQALHRELLSQSAPWAMAALALGPLLATCFALVALHVGKNRDYS